MDTIDATPSPQPQRNIWLVYDGDCPFCSAAANVVQVRRAVGDLHILNARDASGQPLMAEIAAAKLDLNQGVVVKFENRLYHGPDAIHLLAMIGSGNDWLNRLNVSLFRNRTTAVLAYPVLKSLRNLALALGGKRPI